MIERMALMKQRYLLINGGYMYKWAVIYKNTGRIYAVFDSRPEANYCVTDCFGQEWSTVEIVHLYRKIDSCLWDEWEVIK